MRHPRARRPVRPPALLPCAAVEPGNHAGDEPTHPGDGRVDGGRRVDARRDVRHRRDVRNASCTTHGAGKPAGRRESRRRAAALQRSNTTSWPSRGREEQQLQAFYHHEQHLCAGSFDFATRILFSSARVCSWSFMASNGCSLPAERTLWASRISSDTL